MMLVFTTEGASISAPPPMPEAAISLGLPAAKTIGKRLGMTGVRNTNELGLVINRLVGLHIVRDLFT